MFESLKLSDGRELLVQEQSADSNVWVVFFPGSAAELWDLSWGERRALLQGLNANLLIVNKPGIDPRGKVNEKAFEASFRRHQRVSDYLEVLRMKVPSNAKIFLLGFSEGAYLSPEIAVRDRRVRGLALISGGTRSWIDEEVFKPCAVNLRPVLKRIAAVYARPESTSLTWHGVSHATWMSYDNDNTLKAFERLRIPILAMHASEDIMIDLDSARGDLMRLKSEGKDITLKYFEGVDHTLGRSWLKAMRASNAFIARVLRGRVDPRVPLPKDTALWPASL